MYLGGLLFSSMCSLFSAVWILILLQISHVVGHFSIKPLKDPVIGYLHMEVILPCQIEISKPFTDTKIKVQWILNKSSQKIEVKNNQDATKGTRYQNRTQLFDSEFKKGNMSMLLRNINLSDQGSYTCIITTEKWYDETIVELVLAANGGNPTITLAEYKDQGIGLTCSSEGWYPSPQAFWLDSKGKNRTEKSAIADLKVMAGTFSVFASITLEPRLDSEVSCKIINNLVNSKRESRVHISDVFYPTSSPWIGPFIIILMLFGCLIAFVADKLRQNLQKISEFQQEVSGQKDEKGCEEKGIETEKNTHEAHANEIHERHERLKSELELRRIQSHAVAVYLDSVCKHPDLTITHDEKRATLKAFGEAKSAVGSLVVVGKEGYVAGKHYWEVWVGDRMDWELGVLTQAQRDRARKEKFSVPLGEERWALRSVRGDLFSSQNKEKIEKKNIPYSSIGLFLDQESRKMYFYMSCINSPILITTISIQATEKLYPFLSFGECVKNCAQDALGNSHENPLPLNKLEKEEGLH